MHTKPYGRVWIRGTRSIYISPPWVTHNKVFDAQLQHCCSDETMEKVTGTRNITANCMQISDCPNPAVGTSESNE